MKRVQLVLLLSLLTACGPSEQEQGDAAKDVYLVHQSAIQAKRRAMDSAYTRVGNLTKEERANPFDLGDRPAVDITTYPQNGLVALGGDEIDAKFLRVESLREGFEIHRNDSVDDVKRNAQNVVKALDRLRYLGVIDILEIKEPSFTGKDDYEKNGITREFVPGNAKASVFVFDLTDGKYLGASPIEARSSPKVKLRPTEFADQLEFDLRQQIRKAAVTNIQFWDEVNRKK